MHVGDESPKKNGEKGRKKIKIREDQTNLKSEMKKKTLKHERVRVMKFENF